MATLPSAQASALRWFSLGHHMDVCIDICNQIGRLFPSDSYGQIIKQGQLRDLSAKGYLKKQLVEHFGISYWRFSISDSGIACFEEYTNDCSE